MIKSVQKNSILYKNTNNIGLLYEYLGNNAFSERELFELGDLLHREKIMAEFIILNNKGIKKYYLSFFKGENGYGNNLNNFNSSLFYSRYQEMMNLKPEIERLDIFKGNNLKEVELKLYNLETKDDGKNSHRKELLKDFGFKKDKTRVHLLKENFSLYMKDLLGSQSDYKKFIFNKEFIQNLNFDFYSSDQEIFDVTLEFLTGSKFFIFPFYLRGTNSKVGDNMYQELDSNAIMSRFLDTNIITDKDKQGKTLLGYEYKISLKPIESGISVDKNKQQVAVDGFASGFDLDSINDGKNMFFETNHSVFLYTKRPDIQGLIKSFNKEFGTILEISSSSIPKDFNPQYLSHNRFGSSYHVGHLKNISHILSGLKEYYPIDEQGMLLGKEYYSNNDFKVNIFNLVGKDSTDGSLMGTGNTMILGTTGAGKTFFTKNRIFQQNTTDQLIMFDNMDNFAKMYRDMSEKEKKNITLLEYGDDFPNIIGKINADNLTLKQEVLLKILLGYNSDVSPENKTMISAQINNYLKKNIGNVFNLDRFKQYAKALNSEYMTQEQKNLLINKLDGINNTMNNILNHTESFDEKMGSNQKIILSYGKLLRSADKQNGYFILEILLSLTGGYLAYKNNLPDSQVDYRYTMVLYDEAHNVVGKTKELDQAFFTFVREIRNFKSNITLISQFYTDFNETIHSMMKFYVLLDPTNYSYFQKANSNMNTSDNNDDDVGKLNRTFKNFAHLLEEIADKYAEDAKLVEAQKIKETDRTRFCVFANLQNNSLYVLNTK